MELLLVNTTEESHTIGLLPIQIDKYKSDINLYSKIEGYSK